MEANGRTVRISSEFINGFAQAAKDLTIGLERITGTGEFWMGYEAGMFEATRHQNDQLMEYREAL